MSANRFAGKHALVTGAASGIGAAVVRRLAADGIGRLTLMDRNVEALRAADGAYGAVALGGDVADEETWRAAEQAIASGGGLDFCVVNAGIADAAPIAEMDFAAWRRVLSVNLDGAFLTLRTAMRRMNDGGAIVVVASAAAFKAEPGVGAYGASKAGLVQLARVAAKEGAPRRIRVNAIAPGGVETPIWSAMPFFRDLVRQHGSERAAFDAMAPLATPLGRYAGADEIAAQIAFLLSEDAATITGALLASDGGYSL
jgi:NAD(P)-dependent dehydrogenase (short-subunit alcohol dehydrogenase family)